MRPTLAGWGIAGVAIVAMVVGFLFGLTELFQLASICLAAIVVAVVFLLLRHPQIRSHRSTQPTQLRAGEQAQLVLTVSNDKKQATPVLFAKDLIAGTHPTSLTFGAIEADQQIKVGYTIPETARGILEVGPLDVTLQDPLGLLRRRLKGAPTQQFLVRPRLIELGPITASTGRLRNNLRSARTQKAGNDEFYALRPYVLGDDLRKVHWRSAARSDNLLVRQDRESQLGGVTIVADTQAANYDYASFERAIVAVNSLLHAAYKGGDFTQFYTADSPKGMKVDSRDVLDMAEEQLSLIMPSTTADAPRILEQLSRTTIGGTLILVFGKSSPELAGQLANCRVRHRKVIALCCDSGPAPDWAVSYAEQVDLSVLWKQALAVTK